MTHIPPHAKKVFSGILFDIFQREQEMLDGSIQTFEAARRVSTVLVLPIIWDKIATTYEQQPWKWRFYSLYWGRMWWDEDPLAAAKRELEEESWMISDDRTLYQSFATGNKVDKYDHYFIARDCKPWGTIQLDQWWEEIHMRLLSFEEFIEFMLSPDSYEPLLANHLFRLERASRLDEFREILFWT